MAEQEEGEHELSLGELEKLAVAFEKSDKLNA